MVHKTVIAILLILGMPTALFLIYDALMLRSRASPLEIRDFWVCLGGASVILLLEVWGLRFLLRGQFRRKPEWSPRIWRSGTGTWEAIRVPLWIVYVQALIATMIIFLGYGSFPSGCCQECSYNLTGNTSGVCPECGIAAPVV